MSWATFKVQYENVVNSPSATGTSVINYVEGALFNDFNKLNDLYGSEWTIEPSSLGATVPTGYRKIALVVRVNPVDAENNDYHFYMRHSDGTWSHKQGAWAPTNHSISSDPASPVILTDNNINSMAQGSGYDDGIRYYLIGKPPIADYAHEYGHVYCNNTNTFFNDGTGETIQKSHSFSPSGEDSWEAMIDYEDDKDFYQFTPAVSGTYSFSVGMESGDGYMHMAVINQFGVTLKSEVNYASPTITIYLNANTTYYIKVKEDEDHIGRYEFSWSLQ